MEPRPLKEAGFFALLLFEPLGLFLILNVAPYLLRIQPYRRYAVAAAPEMISPVWLPPQVRVVFEYPRTSLPLIRNHSYGIAVST